VFIVSSKKTAFPAVSIVSWVMTGASANLLNYKSLTMESHVPAVTWPKYCGWPPFWKWLYRYISAAIHPISTKFGMLRPILIPRMATSPKIQVSKIQDGGRTPYWASFFSSVCQRHIVWFTRNLENWSRIAFDSLFHLWHYTISLLQVYICKI